MRPVASCPLTYDGTDRVCLIIPGNQEWNFKLMCTYSEMRNGAQGILIKYDTLLYSRNINELAVLLLHSSVDKCT